MKVFGKWAKTLFMAVVALSAVGLVAGCGGSGGSSSGAAPAVPTAPANLPPLEPDAGGASAGFNVSLSAGMVAPPAVDNLDGGTIPGSLVSPVPEPTGGTIIDQDAAIRLGKALFWDMQTGSDGQIACASCHFSAGVDNRTQSTIHPGANAVFEVVDTAGDNFNLITFDPTLTDDVVGSGGVFSRLFGSISTDLNDPVDVCTPLVPGNAAQAAIDADGQRLITGRNSPPAIGAVFYLDNFWDGRASQNFNGLNPLGAGPVVAGLSSLASQALGPPLDSVEMSCAGRTWNGPDSIGAKLVPRTPLAQQQVHPEDSVLGPLSNFPGDGLRCFPGRLCTYADLIAAAFGTNGLTGQEVMDFYIDNFSSIWGQAVQAYEATLVPNQTPYDLGLLNAQQVAGLEEMRKDGCMLCHVEPEFSDATVRLINARGGPTVQKVVAGDPDGGDQGFHNIGVTPTDNDLGRAGSPGGVYTVSIFNDGAFKTPGLRNLTLTAPYMHNGSHATLVDVLEFYDAGAFMLTNNRGFNPDAIVGVGGGAEADVLSFLTTGLLDCRVVEESAPFDHPELVVPNGPTLPAVGRSGNGAVCP
jgi:cytochrome c peroxidase